MCGGGEGDVGGQGTEGVPGRTRVDFRFQIFGFLLSSFTSV